MRNITSCLGCSLQCQCALCIGLYELPVAHQLGKGWKNTFRSGGRACVPKSHYMVGLLRSGSRESVRNDFLFGQSRWKGTLTLHVRGVRLRLGLPSLGSARSSSAWLFSSYLPLEAVVRLGVRTVAPRIYGDGRRLPSDWRRGKGPAE